MATSEPRIENFHHQIKQRLFPRKHPSAASYGFFTLFRFATVVHFVRGGFGGALCSRFFCFSSTALAAARYLLALLRCAPPTSSTKFIWICFASSLRIFRSSLVCFRVPSALTQSRNTRRKQSAVKAEEHAKSFAPRKRRKLSSSRVECCV